jgi:poly(A) polymerase
MLDLLPPDASLPLVLSVLFHDIGKPGTRHADDSGRIRFNGHESLSATLTERLMHRLRFSNDEIRDTVEMVRMHMTFKDVRSMRLARLKRFMARPTFPDELLLHRTDCLGSHGLLDNYAFLRTKTDEFANEPLIPPPLVTGHDLIAMGMKPGPHFKAILEAVETRQLEGNLVDRDDALAWVQNHFASFPPCP